LLDRLGLLEIRGPARSGVLFAVRPDRGRRGLGLAAGRGRRLLGAFAASGRRGGQHTHEQSGFHHWSNLLRARCNTPRWRPSTAHSSTGHGALAVTSRRTPWPASTEPARAPARRT